MKIRISKKYPTLTTAFLFLARAAFGADYQPAAPIYSDDVSPYLKNTNVTVPNEISFFSGILAKPISLDNLLNDESTAELRQQYNDMNRNYDQLKAAGLTDEQTERAYVDQMGGFSRHVLDTVEQQQIDTQQKSIQPNVDDFGKQMYQEAMHDKVLLPVGAAGAVATVVYTGKSFDVWKNQQETLSASANARSQTAQMQFRSPAFSSSVDANMNAPDSRDPGTVFAGDPLSRPDEKLKFTVSRSIASLGINNNIAFRTTSRVLSSTVSKEIVSHVNLAVDGVYPMDPNNSDVKTAGGSVRVNYGFHF